MPIPMQPPPYYAPFIDDQGNVAEVWRRFLLAAQTSIQFLLQTQQRVGSMQGLMPIEDPADDRFAFVIPGPPGPPGAAAPSAAFGAGFMLGSMDVPDDPTAWSPPGAGGVAGVGGGAIVGSIAATQVAFGSAVNTIKGNAGFTFDDVRQLLLSATRPEVQLLTSGTAKARLLQPVANTWFLSTNLSYDGVNWNLDDITLTGGVLSQAADGSLNQQNATAGANPRTLASTMQTDISGNLLASVGTAIPAGGTSGLGYRFSSTAFFGMFFGSGVPTLTAAKGSLYLRSDGASSTRLYVNTNGASTWTSFFDLASAIPDGNLSSNVALKNANNIFTANQDLSLTRPELRLLTSGTAKARFAQVVPATAYITTNLSYDGTNWNLDDTAQAGGILAQTIDGGLTIATATAGANPRTTSVVLSTNLLGRVSTYNAVSTAGLGVPAIYGSGRATAQTGAVASVAAYTVSAADGSFLVSMNILITAFTAGTISGVVAYTDESGTVRSLTLNFSSVTGVLGTTVGAAGAFEGVPMHIRVKASTAIICTTTVSVFTGTYNVEGVITQIA